MDVNKRKRKTEMNEKKSEDSKKKEKICVFNFLILSFYFSFFFNSVLFLTLFLPNVFCPVGGGGCRKYRPRLCGGARSPPPQRVSCGLYWGGVRPLQQVSCGPVGWIWRMHRLLLCGGVRSTPNECPGFDTKQSDGEAPVMLELWGMWSTSSLPSLIGPLCLGMVAPDRVLSMGQIELFDI